mgnify:CR=1 FL=1
MSKFAFLFPGQGSQAVGMMAGFGDHPVVRETFTEASDILKQDLWALVSDGPAEELNKTVNTQPAMLAAGVAVYRLWQAQGGPQAALMAGHSLGEYTALTCAGAMAFKDAIKLVDVRPTLECDLAEDKNAARAALINDCQVAYMQSIGGPAAAKVVRVGVHPIKTPTTGPARETIVRLQSVLDAPPPWLAKIMGVEAKSLSKFAEEEEELDA